MKKLIDKLANGRPSQEHFYSLCDASLPNDRNYSVNKTNVFKYYPFDSDGYDTSQLGDEYLLNSRFKSGYNSEECLAHSLHSTHLSTSVGTYLFDLQSKNDFPLPPRISSGSDGSIMGMKKENDCESEKKNKYRKNVYLINISNSKYFLFGSQKTINVNEKQFTKETAHDCGAHRSFKNYSSWFKVDFQSLLDCQERLAKKYISLISQHVDDRWKEFLKYLGLEKNTLETLESRNNNNRILSVYDSLHNYMTLFPNTSLGFVIFALGQVHQIFVIEKLAEELNKETEDL